MARERAETYDGSMFAADILPHAGRYCEVVTSNGRLFGEPVRLPAGGQRRLAASAICEITDLLDPHP